MYPGKPVAGGPIVATSLSGVAIRPMLAESPAREQFPLNIGNNCSLTWFLRVCLPLFVCVRCRTDALAVPSDDDLK
jgi:hypothetical protein